MRAEDPEGVERGELTMEWGSDALAELLSRLDLKYLALVPGSSYRGLHDSLVNYLGNERPRMIVCLHEEHAVAVAHGYAKVTGRPMAVALHSNVGLMHATMALYNAYCDRVPMLVIGATGPLDAARRRPWIDWIHTAADQGALVRNYVKWDDQPGSVQAALDSLVQAHAATTSYPPAPVYVCLDSAIQESPWTASRRCLTSRATGHRRRLHRGQPRSSRRPRCCEALSVRWCWLAAWDGRSRRGSTGCAWSSGSVRRS